MSVHLVFRFFSLKSIINFIYYKSTTGM